MCKLLVEALASRFWPFLLAQDDSGIKCNYPRPPFSPMTLCRLPEPSFAGLRLVTCRVPTPACSKVTRLSIEFVFVVFHSPIQSPIVTREGILRSPSARRVTKHNRIFEEKMGVRSQERA
jgi:hypothetical protein